MGYKCIHAYPLSHTKSILHWCLHWLCSVQCFNLSWTWCTGFMRVRFQGRWVWIYLFVCIFFLLGYDEGQDCGLELWYHVTGRPEFRSRTQDLSELETSVCDVGRISIFQRSDVDTARLCGDWLHLRKLLIRASKCEVWSTKSRSIIAEYHFEYVWMEILVCSITKTKFAAITSDHWQLLMSCGRVAVNSCFFHQMLVKIALIFKNFFCSCRWFIFIWNWIWKYKYFFLGKMNILVHPGYCSLERNACAYMHSFI